jgi:spermidine synthase
MSTLRRFHLIIALCFFGSGAAGLIYEVVWIRMLGLVFGHTVHAVTTVLVAFMAGLALGSSLGGRIADRIRRPVQWYGALEIAIGGFCLLTPWLISVMTTLYVSVARSVGLPFWGLTLVQFVLASVVLLVPTTLMGATLPILSRVVTTTLDSAGRRVGILYAVNTFGAVVGTFLAGFELLPWLGMRSTLLIAAALNIGLGLAVVSLSRRYTRQHPDAEAADAPVRSARSGTRVLWGIEEWSLAVAFALSGAVAMVYEVTWTRALALIIGSSTYAFSAMLVSFLLGLATGSALFARWATTRAASLTWFAALQLVAAFSAAAVFVSMDFLPAAFLSVFPLAQSAGSYSIVLFIQVGISVAVMLLPTLCFGATFPCVVKILSRDLASVGRDVGLAYAFNTGGAIAGAFAAGFLLVPALGVQLALKVAIVINLLIGLALIAVSDRRFVARITTVGALAAGIAGVSALPVWDREVMSSGVAVYAPLYLKKSSETSFRDRLDDGRVVYYRDGTSATVSVHRRADAISLRVNGKTDASNGADMHTQLMSGHLPALLHGRPERALVIGLASGVTVGALLQHPVRLIDVVEIEPAMIEASSFFKAENRDALADPRVHVVVGDGRNFLLTSEHQYDLIVSEPSNPWVGGVATLFTVEFFDLARRHLAPGGIMVQWFQGYGMVMDDIRMVAASFRSVFPHATLWEANPRDYLLVGPLHPLTVDLERIRAAFQMLPGVREDLARLEMHSPEAILADFYLDETDLAGLTESAGLNDDDRLPLEFSAPRSLYLATDARNEAALRKARRTRYPAMSGASRLERPEVQYHLARALLRKNKVPDALRSLGDALQQDPSYMPALLARGRMYGLLGEIDRAVRDLELARAVAPNAAEIHHTLGVLYGKQQRRDEAEAAFTRAVALAPDNATYRAALGAAIPPGSSGRPAPGAPGDSGVG